MLDADDIAGYAEIWSGSESFKHKHFVSKATGSFIADHRFETVVSATVH